MEYLNKMMESLTKTWNSLDKKNKTYIIAAAAGIILLVVIWVGFSSRVTYAELYDSEVDTQTIGSVETLLAGEGIKYKIASSGKNIMVDIKSIGKARTLIATSDIATSKYTWKDALDKNTLGLTETDKLMNYRLAAQDTLASDLENIDGVKSAIVNLTLPSSDPFILKQTTVARAAVQVELTKALSEKQISGIAKHVMMSVEGLTEENISIIDSDANMLYPSGSLSIGSSTMEYDEIKNARQTLIENRVNELLAPLFDDIRVNVNLQMNFDKYKETKEVITSPLGDDAKVGLISEQHVATQTSTNTATSGEPGLGSNDEDTSYQMNASGSDSSSESNESDTIYKLNTTVSELEKQIGEVSLADSSISIVVYKKLRYDYEELDKKKTFADITWEEFKDQKKEEVTKLEIDEDLIESIEKATGITSIFMTGFTTPVFIEKISVPVDWMGIVPIVLTLAVIIALAMMLVKKLGSVKVVETEPELSVEKLLYSTRPKENDLPEIQEHVSDSYQRIAEFIDDKPDLVAQLLRNWINED